MTLNRQIKKLAQSIEQQKRLQDIVKLIGSIWEQPKTFLFNLFTELQKVYGGTLSFQDMYDSFKYLQKSGSDVKPQKAEFLFHSMGLDDKTIEIKPILDIDYDTFEEFVYENSKKKLPPEYDVLFTSKVI